MEVLKIGEKEFQVRELTYLEFTEIADLQKESPIKASNKMLQLSANLSDEQMKALSVKEGLELIQAVNKVNSGNFQVTTSEKGLEQN